MIRRDSMSFLHAMLEEIEQEQARGAPIRRSLRRSVAIDDDEDPHKEEKAQEEEDDPPDLPTSPQPETRDPDRISLSDGETVEYVRQKRSFDLRGRLYSPGGRHSLDNRRISSSASRSSSSAVPTPFSATDYDFHFWASQSPGISLLSPTRSTSFFSSTPCSFTADDQEDLPAWSSRVVADEASITDHTTTTTVSTLMMSSTVEHHRSISIEDTVAAVSAAAGDGYGMKKGGDVIESVMDKSAAGNNGMSGRSSSTSHFVTSSDGGSTPPLSPGGGRVSSQSESALDEMDDDLLIGGGDLGRTKKTLCGLPSGDAKLEIQYQSLEDIRSAISPIDNSTALIEVDPSSPMGGERWRERRRKSEGGGEERRRSKAEITPSHSPTRVEEEEREDENGNEEERKSRLRMNSSLQQSLERLEGEEGLPSIQSYLGVDIASEEEEYREDEEEEEQRRMDEMMMRNASTELDVIDEADEARSRSVSRHADSLISERDRTVTGGEEEIVLRRGAEYDDTLLPSLDEPADFAPSLYSALQDVSTCGSISYARTPERETVTSGSNTTTTISEETSEMITSSSTGRSLRSAASLSYADRTISNASTSPSEPEELAPGTSVQYTSSGSPSEETMPAVAAAMHRRAISNHETRQEEVQQARRDNEIVRARSSGGRGSMMAGRCLSQVMTPVSLPDPLISPDDAPMSSGRNLSSSDPALNEAEQAELREMQQLQQRGGGVEELQYDGREAHHQPPPVRLPRKQSNLQSWRSPFAVATARGVMNPRVQVPAGSSTERGHAQTSTPPRDRNHTTVAGDDRDEEKRPGERSRVDKKEKGTGGGGGSTRLKMFDSISNTFFSERKSKKSKTSERSLDNFMQQFGVRGAVHPRHGTISGGHPINSPVEGLPDEIKTALEDDARHARLPSMERSPSAIRSPNGTDDYSFELRSLSLSNDLWDRFGLFEPEQHSAWHEKYSTEGMNSKQLKKQDAIFELISQERKHCAHLAFLKKGYRQRLVEEHVLTPGDADRLIPDVLDAMLAFHLHLLERLVERQRVAPRVETVADIIVEELGESGRFTTRALDAYTSFGASKEGAEAYYKQLKAKGGRFAGFIEKLELDANYRKYPYKTLLTVIIGRPTKYQLMFDQIIKNEESAALAEQTKEAAEAARKFAARIDYGLQVYQMSKKWDEIKGQLEHGSKTTLFTGTGSCVFTMDDLRKDTFSDGSRRILCMGDVMVKTMSVHLILFDDILVVLQRKGGRMAFIQHEQAVLPVWSLHIRSTERQNSAYVISNCKPALLQFDFLNRSDKLKWVKSLETAIANAPRQVRMTPRDDADSQRAARERAAEAERMRRAEDEWMRKLEGLFADLKVEEDALATYFDTRRQWFDHVRKHVGEMPYRSKNEIPEKVRQTIRARFRELRSARVIPLAEMVERCTTARDGDLWAYFDDRQEMAAGRSDESDSSGSGKSGRHPRRIQTFHGTTSETREKSSIRRHTTVPKMSECGSTVSAEGGLQRRTESDSSESEEEREGRPETREEKEERMRIKGAYRVPLSLPLRARKASTRLVEDVVTLRLENQQLRNQAALDKTRLAFLEKQRTPGYAAIVAPTETMEALRKKEQELRERENRLVEEEERRKEERRETEETQARLAKQEAELERKWLAFKEQTSTPTRSSSQKENGTPGEEVRREKRVERTASNSSELSPALKGLSVKSETRRKK